MLGGLFHWFSVALLRYHQNPLSPSCGSPGCLEFSASLLIGSLATAVFWQPEAPTHLPQVLQEAWPLGFQKADCHPAFLSCGSLETMENVELLPSSARQQWCPAAPSTSWHGVGVVSLLSPGSPVPEVGKAGPYLWRTVTWWQQLSHVHCVALPQEQSTGKSQPEDSAHLLASSKSNQRKKLTVRAFSST